MKKLCRLKRQEIHTHVRMLAVEGRKPKFVCTLCGRVASDRRQLCDPLKIRSHKRKKK